MEIHMPWRYVRSTFNRYLSGRCRARGYQSLRQAARRIRRRSRWLQRRGTRAVTFWYIPHYDTLCHDHGVASTQAAVSWEISRACCWSWPRRCPTGRHGADGRSRPDRPDPRPEGGDLRWRPVARLPARRAERGRAHAPLPHPAGPGPELVERLADRCGERMAVLSLDEAEEMRLFGPEPLSDQARRRFGDYVGVTLEPSALATTNPRTPSG